MAGEKKGGKKGEDAFDIDFGIGKLGLGGIFKGIEKLVDLASELEKAGGEIKKEGEIDLSNLKDCNLFELDNKFKEFFNLVNQGNTESKNEKLSETSKILLEQYKKFNLEISTKYIEKY